VHSEVFFGETASEFPNSKELTAQHYMLEGAPRRSWSKKFSRNVRRVGRFVAALPRRRKAQDSLHS
jgi:hypothetical protein